MGASERPTGPGSGRHPRTSARTSTETRHDGAGRERMSSERDQSRGIPRLLVVVLAAMLVACGVPAEPQGTLAEARGSELHVGVVHDPPWAIVEGGEAVGGIEVRLLRGFADSIDADPVFHPGDLSDLAEALGQFELDLLAGGLTAASPWGSRLALSPPYYTEPVVVAGTAPVLVDDLDGAPVAYPEDEPQLAQLIQSADGTAFAVPVGFPAAAPDRYELVAVPLWRAEQLGLHPSGLQLTDRKRVLALPPGENQLLLELAGYLHDEAPRVETLLDAGVAP